MVYILKMEKQEVIKGLVGLGWSNRRIAKEVGVDRRTVGRYRRQNAPIAPPDPGAAGDQNVPIVPPDSEAPPPTKSEQLCPLVEVVQQKVQTGLTAQRIYQDLVEEHAYRGSYSSVKRYVRKFKVGDPDYVERLESPPAEEAQVDFGRGAPVWHRGKYRRPWLFIMTLSYSRHAYYEQVLDQRLETFLRCHEHAFRFFGGVVRTVRLDNLKSGVLQACFYDPESHPVYLAFAKHWGFIPNPCPPSRPWHKGKVERNVGYGKGNALKGRKFESLEASNAFLRQWNKRWARTRIHGTTKQQVWQRFVEHEQAALLPLPERDFEWFRAGSRKVDVDGFISVDNAYYQVPAAYIGRRLDIYWNQQWVKVLVNGQVVAQYRATVPGQTRREAAFNPPYKHPDRQSQENHYVRQARAVGPFCHRLVRLILDQDDPMAIRRTRGILALARKYGPVIMEAASARALAAERYAYPYVKHLCQDLALKGGDPQPRLTQHDDLIRTGAEYQRFFEDSVAQQQGGSWE